MEQKKWWTIVYLTWILIFLCGFIIALINNVDAYNSFRDRITETAPSNGNCAPPVNWALARNCTLQKCDTCINTYTCTCGNLICENSYTDIVTDCSGRVLSFKSNSGNSMIPIPFWVIIAIALFAFFIFIKSIVRTFDF